METIVRRYAIEYAKDTWLEIVRMFRQNISPNGVPYFKGETVGDAESEFLRFCLHKGLRITQKIILEYSGKGPLLRSHYYFSVHDTREYDQGFIELSCDGGGKGLCWNGAKQVRKVPITEHIAKVVGQRDIAVKNYPISPRVYLISRKLKELMDPFQFSGCTVVPCLQSGQTYSVEESAFSLHCKKWEKASEYFQLIITARTVALPSIGNLLVASRCPRCKSASVLDGDKYCQFHRDDLSSTDFQCFKGVASANQGIIRLVGEIPIVSARVLQFFIENKIKGLKPYSSDPPVKYAIVDVQENTV
jgi:hypothetical protein